MTGERWKPDPSWPPEVTRFIAGLYAYLLTLPPEEQRRVMRETAIHMLEFSVDPSEESDSPSS